MKQPNFELRARPFCSHPLALHGGRAGVVPAVEFGPTLARSGPDGNPARPRAKVATGCLETLGI